MIGAARYPSRPRLRSTSTQVSSVVAVVVTACGLDLMADATLLHVLGVVLAAATVGAVRLALRGRLWSLFVLVNVAVLAQPAAHALTTLTHAGASRLHHDHVVPQDTTALALQLAFTLLVVVVASSEPLLVAGRRAHLQLSRTVLGLAPLPPDVAGSRPPRHTDAAPRRAVIVRCRPHRGPPAAAVSIA